MKRFVLAAILLSTAACGGGEGRPAKDPSDAAAIAAQVRAFGELEDEILRDLATIDSRVARRAHINPREEDLRRVSMAAMLREDPTVAVVEGAIDPFSFDARTRGLDAVRAKVAKVPRDLPATAEGLTERPALERELLERLVEEEAVRLDEERLLPRSASALVRAVVEGWRPAKTPKDLEEQDRWLSRRLGELGRSLKDDSSSGAPTMDLVRARELDDALDALEHATPGMIKTMQELVRIREALEAQGARPTATKHSEWTDVARRAKAHLGAIGAPEELERELGAVATKLRAEAEKALAAVDLKQDALTTRLAPLLFPDRECVNAIPGSRIRSMAAPPERTPACLLRHVVASAQDETARAIALVAMHDHVVVAQWALAVATGAATLDQAQSKHRLLSLPTPDVAARLERIALARPVAAIGAGEAVRILVKGDAAARANAWSRLGDLPLDLAARELAAAPNK